MARKPTLTEAEALTISRENPQFSCSLSQISKPSTTLTLAPSLPNTMSLSLHLLLAFSLHLLLTFSLLSLTTAAAAASSPYFSPTTLFPNYQKMLTSFKIYIYPLPPPYTDTTIFTSSPDSLFYASLRQSPFLTQDPNEAHLFFVPFHSSLSTRSIARLVRGLRAEFPFWNRTLGADHFYLSSAGIDYSSDRNVVELKKNSVQISSFPTTSGLFIPHKDITFPPLNPSPIALPENYATTTYVGYMKKSESVFVDDLIGDPDFAVEMEPSGSMIKSSMFCLFMYGGDMTWMVEAMALGCVPAVITDRPIQDMPLMDVLKWSEIGVFVGTGGGAKGLKEVLGRINEVEYDRMRESCVTASQHLVWNAVSQPHDAFQMVMYQLWLRRHTIRYPRWESV